MGALDLLHQPITMSQFATVDDLCSAALRDRRCAVEIADELLAALKNLDAYIDFSYALEPGGWGVTDPTGINAAFEQARAAIAKATQS